MPNFEHIPRAQEIVNEPETYDESADRNTVNQIERILAPILLERHELPKQILDLEQELHRFNEERCTSYGRIYHRPKIFYINRQKRPDQYRSILKNAAQSLAESAFTLLDQSMPFYSSYYNCIFLHLGASDTEENILSAMITLRHEMSHAGSVTKRRYLRRGAVYKASDYRSGANVFIHSTVPPHRLFTRGEVFTEGLINLEDKISRGDIHQDKYPTIRVVKLPEYETSIKDKVVFTVDGKDYILLRHSYGLSYTSYIQLLEYLCGLEPQFAKYIVDLVYGDKMIQLARFLNTLGRTHFNLEKLFTRIMDVRNIEEAALVLFLLKNRKTGDNNQEITDLVTHWSQLEKQNILYPLFQKIKTMLLPS